MFLKKDPAGENRVAWSECLNLMTDDPSIGWRRMAYVAMNNEAIKRGTGQKPTGAKLQKPVYTYSISWHPSENPTRKKMMKAVRETLAVLGLADHQSIIAAHADTEHPHVHVVTNAVSPQTGLVAKLDYTKRKLSKYALEYERKEGHMYCPQRELNAQKRKSGLKSKFCDRVIREAWENSTNAFEFQNHLQKADYALAKGRRLVVVDPHGNVINPVRALGITTKEFKERLGNLSDIQALNDTPKDTQKERAQFILNKRKEMEDALGMSSILSKILKIEFKIAQAGILQRLTGIQSFRIRKLESLRQELSAMNRHIDDELQRLENHGLSATASTEHEKRSEP
ncbi:MAG: relaxase/mobilization nuclease domain-containing protein [Opitutales bacterium]